MGARGKPSTCQWLHQCLCVTQVRGFVRDGDKVQGLPGRLVVHCSNYESVHKASRGKPSALVEFCTRVPSVVLRVWKH
jgi:hypothetical protein